MCVLNIMQIICHVRGLMGGGGQEALKGIDKDTRRIAQQNFKRIANQNFNLPSILEIVC